MSDDFEVGGEIEMELFALLRCFVYITWHFQRDYVMRSASQSNARWAFVVKQYIMFFVFFKKMTDRFARSSILVWDRVEPFEAALKLQFDLQPVGNCWSPLYGEKILECFPQKP